MCLLLVDPSSTSCSLSTTAWALSRFLFIVVLAGAPSSVLAPSSFLFLAVRPGAPSSVLAPSSTARSVLAPSSDAHCH